MGAERNLVKSRFWPHFLTILYIKIVYFLVLYFICRFFLPSVGLYSIEFEAIWKICFACMKVYFEKNGSLFVTNYCIFLINGIRLLWRKRCKNHIIICLWKSYRIIIRMSSFLTGILLTQLLTLIFSNKFKICDIQSSIIQTQF